MSHNVELNVELDGCRLMFGYWRPEQILLFGSFVRPEVQDKRFMEIQGENVGLRLWPSLGLMDRFCKQRCLPVSRRKCGKTKSAHLSAGIPIQPFHPCHHPPRALVYVHACRHRALAWGSRLIGRVTWVSRLSTDTSRASPRPGSGVGRLSVPGFSMSMARFLRRSSVACAGCK